MPDEGRHAARVSEWLAKAAPDGSSIIRLRLFETALGALWARAATTLGEVTLAAIAERVLSNTSERFPPLSSLTVEATGGISFRAFHDLGGTWQDPELTEGIQFVLVEFLTVLGSLTAEILTPELHEELSHVGLSETTTTKDAEGRNNAS